MTKVSLPAIESFTRQHDSFCIAKSSNPLTKRERVSLYFAIIHDVPRGCSCKETKDFADSVLNTIEDEFSGVPYDEGDWKHDDRLYPAKEDNRRHSPVDEVSIYRHKQHESYFGINGAIRVVQRTGKVFSVDLAGSDGLTIGDLLESGTQQLPVSSS
ncbi:hypothetical protein [Piscinibacter gummiphilus]|uniref:hypothetical protein n=1 Tax=Piscinibacter gummiphilus TaxID=946333 RepID=UPI0012F52A23|nr:hypothetical protein [Piscinibacter gummiphilus]GLS95303.1 hypothetical protein GCM10007918_25950 [Piscinibacter gummiphilus]